MKFLRFQRGMIAAAVLFYAMIFAANQPVIAQLVCQPSGSPIVQTGALTTGDATQTGRINRNGITGSCPVGKTNSIFNSTQVLAMDSYNYTAPVTGCAIVSVNMTQCGGATTQVAAYSSYSPTSPGNNVISDFGFSTTGVADFGFPVQSGQNFTIVVHDILETPTNLLCGNYTFTITYKTSCQQPGFDRDNDGKANIAVFTPSSLSTWSFLDASNNTVTRQFGSPGDIPVAGDHTGDGQTDLAVYRPSNNTWFYATNQTTPASGFVGVPWGTAGDHPAPGDYDADGKADVAIWRPSNGTWYVLRSSDNTVQYFGWGQNGDVPVFADFDGDLKTDFAVVRPNTPGITPTYQWYIANSNFNFGFLLNGNWGTAGDIPVPADYDGNGKADIAVYRPSDGSWRYLPSVAQNVFPTVGAGASWGVSGDVPQPADYDGDLTADFSVFRPSNNTWYVRNSATNTATVAPFGTTGDKPATAPYPVQ